VSGVRLLVVAVALAVAAVGIWRGTWAIGGSDSSCYALMAAAFAGGHLQPTTSLAEAPWPDAPRTFAPGGFVPSPNRRDAASPICTPGFSLLLAPLVAIGGRDAIFLLTPIAGALLVWLTFLFGRELAGPNVGAAAALVVAASPVFVFQVVQPMNDVAVAAVWMAVMVLAARPQDHSGWIFATRRPRVVWPVMAIVVVFAVTTEAMGQAMDLHRLERRFRTVGMIARDRLPTNAVFITVWNSGSVRYHADRDAILWDAMDPASLDLAVAWLSARWLEPYLVVEVGGADLSGSFCWPLGVGRSRLAAAASGSDGRPDLSRQRPGALYDGENYSDRDRLGRQVGQPHSVTALRGRSCSFAHASHSPAVRSRNTADKSAPAGRRSAA
jgi:hypothetical protein